MTQFFGDCTTLFTSQTLFVKNYEKYHLEIYDEELIKQRHETVFHEIRKKAYELGENLIKKEMKSI